MSSSSSSVSSTSVARFLTRRVRIATGLVCATVAAVALSAGGANADGAPEDPHGDLHELSATEFGLPENGTFSAAAMASGDNRPDFQMPFKCGEVWQGASRSGHSPSPNAVDWTQGGSTANSPVVASAAGTATVTDLGGRSYGKYVIINHGGGWSTVYAHLNGFSISNGAQVKAGQQIGIVGSTGNSTGAHLHYEQRYNRDDQRTVFNDTAFYGSGRWSKSLTSKNCATKTPEPPKPTGPGGGETGNGGMTDLASADLNGDNVVDVVGVEASTGKLWMYKGSANGTIAGGGNRVMIGSGGWNGMSNLTGGDFTGDGKDDIVGVEESTGKLWLYKGADNSSLATRVMIGSGGWNGMSNLTGLNLNGDKIADLAAVETSTGKLYLYPGTAGGQIGARKEIGSGGWNGMSNLTGMDLNNSGRQDLVAVEKSSGKLFMYPGDKGYLSPRIEIGSGGWNGMSDLIGGDLLNSSLSDDLIAVQNTTGKLFLYPGTGSGGLGDRKEIGTAGW
ncbi:VCBS repeat domain-containing M23 family metallopeptidase [Streptomyces xanthophaeus]|uniref:VCBS repeat domain-containing M23 family metallopeptidase n=1 Tax=Streptomyces xanthophaeus TaxID=67385 RepID=UPI00233EC096|nr:VCBS repeat domain-containing M23 family metallopeptidase [Streptomyces xanthophaeus]WCD87873.1 Murein DD-endopeptidase MepM [Streptomyces xanthophaeus]